MENIKEKYMEKNFNNIIKEIRKCNICEDKFGFKPHPVVIGSATSKIVQISQAPSKMVDTILKPFTDQSGKKLKYEWYQITDEEFYNLDNFFITALAHCYPGKDKNGCDKAPPKICYEKWIKKELEYIDNILYIIIGAKAAKIFFPDEDYNDLIFKNNILFNKPAIVLPHPSPLNIKWFKDNPDFIKKRIIEIRKIINNTLNKN